LIDFSKAFDVVNHPTVARKLPALHAFAFYTIDRVISYQSNAVD